MTLNVKCILASLFLGKQARRDGEEAAQHRLTPGAEQDDIVMRKTCVVWALATNLVFAAEARLVGAKA